MLLLLIIAVQCSQKCQLADWKLRHKKVCKEAAKHRRDTEKVGKMFQLMSDMSLSGTGPQARGPDDLGQMIRDATTDPGVKARRDHLKAEKRR